MALSNRKGIIGLTLVLLEKNISHTVNPNEFRNLNTKYSNYYSEIIIKNIIIYNIINNYLKDH